MLLFWNKKKEQQPNNEFISIEKRFEQLFWQQLPPLDNVHIYLLPEEARTLGLEDSNFIKVDTMVTEGKSVFECVQVGNLVHEQLVFKPIKQLEQFINNSDIILRKLM